MSEEVRRQDKGKERRIKDNLIHVYMDSDHNTLFDYISEYVNFCFD